MYFEERKYFKIFVFRIEWKTIENRTGYDVGIKLIGLKYLIAKNGMRWNYATPLMN